MSRGADRFHPGASVQFGHEAADVRFHGARVDTQHLSDLLVGLAPAYQREYFHLAVTQSRTGKQARLTLLRRYLGTEYLLAVLDPPHGLD